MLNPSIRRRLHGLVLGLAMLSSAAPALAVPALFSGTLSVSQGYLGFGPPPGLGTPFTVPVTGCLTVVTTSVGFAISSSSFSTSTSAITSAKAHYVYVTRFLTLRKTGAGAFFQSYLTTPTTGAANTTMSPMDSGSPRTGYLRLIPSPNGLGGNMKVLLSNYSRGRVLGPPGYYDFVRYRT